MLTTGRLRALAALRAARLDRRMAIRARWALGVIAVRYLGVDAKHQQK